MASATPNALIKNFLKTYVPAIKRIGSGHLALMELFLKFKRNNISIPLDVERFIPSSEMQDITISYPVIREACLIMKGYSNRMSHKCDRIIGYTEQFDQLFLDVLNYEFKLRKQSTSNKAVIGYLYKTAQTLLGDLYPGWSTENYTKTENSERYYIWLQNLKKEHKQVIYSGLTDLGITAAFPNIFVKEICGGKYINEDMQLMIESPEEFLNKCIVDDIYNKLYPYKGMAPNDRNSAKKVRSRLFHPSAKKGRLSGVDWYDKLQGAILQKLNESGISNAHMFFTNRELAIVNVAAGVIGESNIVLRMHDGFICDVTLNDELLNALQCETGYAWKAKVV